MKTVRHFTATGYLVHKNSVYLHWHEKVKMWLPPGGHIEDNEDPVQAVKREVLEETVLESVIVERDQALSFEYPKLVSSPRYIMVEDIDDPQIGFHQHIDLIYYCRPKNGVQKIKQGWIAIGYDDLRQNQRLTIGEDKSVLLSQDVREMSMEAIKINLKHS